MNYVTRLIELERKIRFLILYILSIAESLFLAAWREVLLSCLGREVKVWLWDECLEYGFLEDRL